MEIDIQFDSFNKIYNKGTNITGSININSNERLVEFAAINLTLTVRYY